MKWFHHECAARHDPKLQILGSTQGAEGLGIFWGLLEEIGQHSDTFHLKILGISEEADQSFMKTLDSPSDNRPAFVPGHLALNKIPRLPFRILARNLFTSQRKLRATIETCVEVSLFDPHKWLKFNVLYSPSFEQRADDYTRRLQRKNVPATDGSEKVRTDSEQGSNKDRAQSEESPNSLRSKSEKVPLETEAEQTERREEADKKLHAHVTPDENELSTSSQRSSVSSQSYLIDLSEEEFLQYCEVFRSSLVDWNEDRPNKFDWHPTDSELRKLFFSGEREHKVAMCYHAYNLLGENIHYAQLVLRALWLMLSASEKTRIVNPFGWLWTCLHGNGDGTTPWVQLLTAEEEQSLASTVRRHLQSDRPP